MMNIPRLVLAVLWFSTAAAIAQATADSSAPKDLIGLELRTPEQMSAADSQVVATHATGIARAAEIYGYELDGSWSYQQVVCPVAPSHVLLDYRHTETNGSVSSFSAVVPKQGRIVEIFPVTRSGMAPYVRSWGEHSYAVFNSLVTDERTSQKKLDMDTAFSVPWKQWALCYVALVTTPPKDSRAPYRLDSEVTVSVGDRGTAQVGFTAGDGEMSYSDWSLTFSPKVTLTSASREQHAIVFTPGGDGLPKGRLIPETGAPAKAPEAP